MLKSLLLVHRFTCTLCHPLARSLYTHGVYLCHLEKHVPQAFDVKLQHVFSVKISFFVSSRSVEEESTVTCASCGLSLTNGDAMCEHIRCQITTCPYICSQCAAAYAQPMKGTYRVWQLRKCTLYTLAMPQCYFH